MRNKGLQDNITEPDSADASTNAQEYDAEDAIHQAVLAEKEQRSPKLVQPRRAAAISHLTKEQATGAAASQSPNDTPGIRNVPAQQRLTHEIILLWAEMHLERTGAWPERSSGAISGCPGEWWNLVDDALKKGDRGLPGGQSLAEILNELRDVLHRANVTELTEEQILLWADEWQSRTGAWPDKRSCEPAANNTDFTWSMINSALLYGSHGLPGGTNLRKLLRERQG